MYSCAIYCEWESFLAFNNEGMYIIYINFINCSVSKLSHFRVTKKAVTIWVCVTKWGVTKWSHYSKWTFDGIIVYRKNKFAN